MMSLSYLFVIFEIYNTYLGKKVTFLLTLQSNTLLEKSEQDSEIYLCLKAVLPVLVVGSVTLCCVAGSGGCWRGCHCIQSGRNSDTATALQEHNVSTSLSLLLTNISNKYLNIRTLTSSNILFRKSSGTTLFCCFLFCSSLLYSLSLSMTRIKVFPHIS